MRWFGGKSWFANPAKVVKIIVLFVCGIFTISQVSECIEKLKHPPVSTHYMYMLNDTVKYPSVTLCRRPAFKINLFPAFGMRTTDLLEGNSGFSRFNFDNFTLSEFMDATTYQWKEVVSAYAYAGTGSNHNLSISSFFHLTRGRCFTVEPLVESDTFSPSGGYVFFLKHNIMYKSLDMYGVSESGFPIFMHDPSEILIYNDDQKDSYLNEIYLESSEDMSLVLDVREFHQISTTENPCVASRNYSKSRCQELCVHRQVAQTANCTTPWLFLQYDVDFPECDNYDSVRNLILDFRKSRDKYLKNCNCPQACNITIYSTSIINRKAIDEQNAPSSTITLYYSTNLVTVMTEIAGYDWNQFISDVGGSLGFLLGLSVLSVICLAEEICQLVIKCMFKRKLKEKEEATAREEKSKSGNPEPVESILVDSKNNILKKEEEDQVINDKYDYKYLKDFTTDYRIYENNLFNRGKNDDVLKY